MVFLARAVFLLSFICFFHCVMRRTRRSFHPTGERGTTPTVRILDPDRSCFDERTAIFARIFSPSSLPASSSRRDDRPFFSSHPLCRAKQSLKQNFVFPPRKVGKLATNIYIHTHIYDNLNLVSSSFDQKRISRAPSFMLSRPCNRSIISRARYEREREKEREKELRLARTETRLRTSHPFPLFVRPLFPASPPGVTSSRGGFPFSLPLEGRMDPSLRGGEKKMFPCFARYLDHRGIYEKNERKNCRRTIAIS